MAGLVAAVIYDPEKRRDFSLLFRLLVELPVELTHVLGLDLNEEIVLIIRR